MFRRRTGDPQLSQGGGTQRDSNNATSSSSAAAHDIHSDTNPMRRKSERFMALTGTSATISTTTTASIESHDTMARKNRHGVSIPTHGKSLTSSHDGSPARRKKGGVEENEGVEREKSLSELVPRWRTWNDVHREICLEQSSLIASFQQVTETYPNFSQFPESRDDLILWTEVEDGNHYSDTAARVCQKLNEQEAVALAEAASTKSTATSSTSWTKRLWKSTARGASTLILGADDDYDGGYDVNLFGKEHLGGTDDDGLKAPTKNKNDRKNIRHANHSNSNSVSDEVGIVEPEEQIVNLDLVRSCLQELEVMLRNQPMRVVLRKRNDKNNSSIQPSVVEWFSFQTWCRQAALQCQNHDVKRLLANMNERMCNFLGDLLVAKNLARLAPPNREDRVLLGGGSGSSSVQDLSDSEIESMVTLFDLQLNEESMNKNLQVWSAKADEYGRSALEAKRNGRIRQSVLDLKRRKMLLHQVEHTRNMLLQLEQLRHTLEHAQTQSQVLDCLQSTADALRTIRTDPDALTTLQMEMNDLKQSSTAVEEQNFGSIVAAADVDDDDELLLELDALDVTDNRSNDRLTDTSSQHMSWVGATTGMENMSKPSKTAMVATSQGMTRGSPTRNHKPDRPSSRTQKVDADDIDIRDLERRLEALRAPASTTTAKPTASSNRNASTKTLPAVAF